MEIGAFFDIDGTLTRTSLMLKHFEKLVQTETIDIFTFVNEVKPISDSYNKRHTFYDDYLENIASLYTKALKGVKFDFIDHLARQVVEAGFEEVYKYTRSRLEFHKKMGHKIFFISGSPHFLVSHIAKKYEVTDFLGTIYEIDENNFFTGNYFKMWDSSNKLKTMRQFVEKYSIDLSKSFSYGDTTGDLSMFRLSGNPITINPSNNLLKKIRNDELVKEKIKIIVERKDVIYSLGPDTKTLDLY